MIPFAEIPADFILGTFTEYQRKAMEIKYYVKEEMKKWEDDKVIRYRELGKELFLSWHRIRKIAEL